MTRTHIRMFGLAFFVALTACSRGSQEDAPASYRNPVPKDAYKITMTLKDAPGPFAFMKGLAQYDVVNRECLRPPKHNPGGRTAPVPTDDVEIPLQKVSDTEYVGTVYADQMLDKDFTGRGVCHWKLIQLRVHMKAKEEEGLGQVIPSIPGEKLLNGMSDVVYFNKASYSSRDMENEPISFGQSDRTRFGPTLADSDLFTVTFASAKDGAP